jgi:Cu(I)/Ag(I) efflux system membrane protein CusA/SilA
MAQTFEVAHPARVLHHLHAALHDVPSASEATIVMLSVVYAMTGGVILRWLLGYNFSVAVCVGYIALYGVAVQTGVVMVVYLHEALDKRLRQSGDITEQDILEATVAGSVLRLRPSMTVSVVMAGPDSDSLERWSWVRRDEADCRTDYRGMVTSTIHCSSSRPSYFTS